MDALGQTVRDFLQVYRKKQVLTASTLAKTLRKEGMSRDQVEEMLYAGDYESAVVEEVVQQLFPARTSR
jgi:hypothetical protein